MESYRMMHETPRQLRQQDSQDNNAAVDRQALKASVDTMRPGEDRCP